jgi:hypothetical protein
MEIVMPEDKIEENSETKEKTKAEISESSLLGKTSTFEIDFVSSATYHETELTVTVPDFKKSNSEDKK